MSNQPDQNDYVPIIGLIFNDAQKSVKELNDSIQNLNTQLSAVTGFSAALIKLADDLPDRDIVLSSDFPCNTCSLLKIVSLILFVLATFTSIMALVTKKGGEDQFISPTEQVEKCLDLSQDEYKLLFIKQYERDIESLSNLRNLKGQRLFLAGGFFVAATIASAVDLLLSTGLSFL